MYKISSAYSTIFESGSILTLYNNNITSLEEYITLVEEWIEFYNTDRLKGKKVNKKKGYKKNDK